MGDETPIRRLQHPPGIGNGSSAAHRPGRCGWRLLRTILGDPNVGGADLPTSPTSRDDDEASRSAYQRVGARSDARAVARFGADAEGFDFSGG